MSEFNEVIMFANLIASEKVKRIDYPLEILGETFDPLMVISNPHYVLATPGSIIHMVDPRGRNILVFGLGKKASIVMEYDAKIRKLIYQYSSPLIARLLEMNEASRINGHEFLRFYENGSIPIWNAMCTISDIVGS